jgi:acylphosphatase
MSDDQVGGVVAGRWLISGRVQGVGFRWFVVRQAERFGVCGWTRNLADGKVEVLAAADQDSLREFVAAVSEGPLLSRVDNVEKTVVPHEMVWDKTFSIK